MAKEPTAPVELTLEESGMLCHLLMPLILATQADVKGPLGISMQPLIHRMEKLHAKLCDTNDKLRGHS